MYQKKVLRNTEILVNKERWNLYQFELTYF